MDGSSTVNQHQPSFLQLNDDCLLKIMDKLDALDLCAIKDTCRRFRNLSTYCFQLTWKDSFSFGKNRRIGESMTECDATRILLHFGKYIINLTLHAMDLNAEVDILHKIGKYKNIKELNLIDTENMAKCNEIFSHLERLSFCCCYSIGAFMYDFLSNCKMLKHLVINDAFNDIEYTDRGFLATKFGQLESLSLINTKYFERSKITRCFKEHANLKKVEMISCKFTDDYIFRCISDHLVNIEEISIQLREFTDSFQTNVSTLLKLNGLKRLEFNCGQKPIVEFIRSLAASNSMEHLSISNTELNKDLCDALIKLQNLKTLKLISMQKPFKNFPKLLQQSFKQLEQLFIVDFCEFNAHTVFEIVSTAGNLKKLFIQECSQFAGFDQFPHLLECRKKCYNGSDLIVYMEMDALKTTKEINLKEILENGETYIKLRSIYDDTIKNERIISDKVKDDGYDSDDDAYIFPE